MKILPPPSQNPILGENGGSPPTPHPNKPLIEPSPIELKFSGLVMKNLTPPPQKKSKNTIFVQIWDTPPINKKIK